MRKSCLQSKTFIIKSNEGSGKIVASLLLLQQTKEMSSIKRWQSNRT